MHPYIQYILEGITLGIGLSVMMGPIFVAITQASIEKGGRAGIIVGTGIWVSDIIIITCTYLFVYRISGIVSDGTFQYWMGLLGGFILIVFGISAMVKKVETEVVDRSYSARSIAGYWLKGFLVNTINPFTFIFWIGVISTYVIGKRVAQVEALIFLASIMTTIIAGDIMKVVLAKYLRTKLREGILHWVIKGAGFLLLVFGLVLIYRVQ